MKIVSSEDLSLLTLEQVKELPNGSVVCLKPVGVPRIKGKNGLTNLESGEFITYNMLNTEPVWYKVEAEVHIRSKTCVQ